MNTSISSRITLMRQAMERHGIAACIVPSADPHLSEYLPEHWQARVWLSGFTGSAGTLVITAQQTGLWTDSRYFPQAEQQLAGSGIALMKLGVPTVPDYVEWLVEHLQAGDRVAIAGDCVSLKAQREMEQQLGKIGVQLRTDLDLPDQIWSDRPALPQAPITEHALDYACITRADKLARVRAAMREYGISHHLLSSLDDIAWLTNLRGCDIACNPVFLAHLIISTDAGATLFIEHTKLDDALRAKLKTDGIVVADYGSITTALAKLPAGSSLLFDPARVVCAVAHAIPNQVRCTGAANPTTLFKAVKSDAELEHIREVMRRDGAALAHAFREIEQQLSEGKPLTELDVHRLVYNARATQTDFVGESFATVAAYQANAAMPHYRATRSSHSPLKNRGLLLIDSGGQYLGGTTDITRMLALGPLDAEQKRDATLVLKGMIALTCAHFPRGASGSLVDALARAPLWAYGMDYGHGTGHGVGYFLNVHEGPQSIRPPVPGEVPVPLKPGMISSIEPGLYKPGRYGIRHEILAVVVEAMHSEFGHYHTFEVLTLCPFDRRVLELSLLSADERAWLDNYHAKVYSALSPLLEGTDLAWLSQHCAPLANPTAADQRA